MRGLLLVRDADRDDRSDIIDRIPENDIWPKLPIAAPPADTVDLSGDPIEDPAPPAPPVAASDSEDDDEERDDELDDDFFDFDEEDVWSEPGEELPSIITHEANSAPVAAPIDDSLNSAAAVSPQPIVAPLERPEDEGAAQAAPPDEPAAAAAVTEPAASPPPEVQPELINTAPPEPDRAPAPDNEAPAPAAPADLSVFLP